ncbi:MAG: ABZJ_00895 family protein [Paracoccaceae bacterium]
MTDTPNAGLTRPLLAFAAAFLAGQGLLYALGMLLPDLDLPSSIGLALTFVAALIGGQVFARAAARPMSRGERLRYAALATVFAVGLMAAALAGLFLWYRLPFTLPALSLVMAGDANAAAMMGGWLWLLLGVGVLATFTVCYLAASVGARAAMQQQARAEGRKG